MKENHLKVYPYYAPTLKTERAIMLRIILPVSFPFRSKST